MRMMRYTISRIIVKYNFGLASEMVGHQMEADKVDRKPVHVVSRENTPHL